MRGNTPDPDYGTDVKDLVEHGVSFDDKVLAAALRNIYRKNFNIETELEPNLFEATVNIFDDATAEGFATAISDGVEINEAFIKAIKENTDVFAAFRTHKMQGDIAKQLLTEDGQLKTFSQFVKDSSPYLEHTNRAWLQTEYDTAVNRAHQAAQWEQFQEEKDVWKNLKWIDSTSPNPGADHKVFWGTVRPVDDAFWDVHRPGDRWNCKCSLEQTDEPVTDVPDSKPSDEPSPGLENNPGKDKQLFSKKHPYYPKNCSSCPFTENKLAALVQNLAGGRKCESCKVMKRTIGNIK